MSTLQTKSELLADLGIEASQLDVIIEASGIKANRKRFNPTEVARIKKGLVWLNEGTVENIEDLPQRYKDHDDRDRISDYAAQRDAVMAGFHLGVNDSKLVVDAYKRGYEAGLQRGIQETALQIMSELGNRPTEGADEMGEYIEAILEEETSALMVIELEGMESKSLMSSQDD